MKKVELSLGGLTCAHCASIIDEEVAKRSDIKDSNLNFVAKKLTFKIEDEFEKDEDRIIEEIKKTIDSIEPGLNIEKVERKIAHRSNSNSSHAHENNNGDEFIGIVEKDTHEHNHEHEGENRWLFVAIAMYVLSLALEHIFNYRGAINYILLFLAYLLSGYEVVFSAFRNLFKGRLLDENFLMTVATFGAVAIGEYPEAVGVMLFYGIGEYLEGKAVGKSRKNIESLMDIRPDTANLIVDGNVVVVDPFDVEIGQTVLVKVGEKVPLDGRIVKGNSRFDTSAITGESVHRSYGVDDEIMSGIINKYSAVEVQVTKAFEDSTVSKILDMVENASTKKSQTENFITVFSRYYTPVVVVLALIIAIVPTLVLGDPFSKWLYRGLIFLVVSCPCALVLSIPLSYFSGIGISSSHGILIKGSNYLEALRSVNKVVMDKTGTLTKGVFKVSNVYLSDGIDESDFFLSLRIAESRSTHPIAQSIISYIDENKKEYVENINFDEIEEYNEIAARGIDVRYLGKRILAGNSKLLMEKGIAFEESDSPSTKVYLSSNGRYLGLIEISDEIKEDSLSSVKKLSEIGIESIMLTGDGENTAFNVASKLGIKRYFANLLPDQKVEKLEEIMNEKDSSKVAFVGDGINDAPVIARSDVGISMGGVGSDAAIEASDIVIMTDEIGKIYTGIEIAKLTHKIVWQNIVMAIGVKVVVMFLSTIGMANMWMAIFADVGVALLAVINSLRVLMYREK